MTLSELYAHIGGDYEQALRVLRIDRLLDKHIRRFATNDVMDRLVVAKDTMDPTELFEAAHAAKGVCGNLGLVDLAEGTSQIAEEFRPGVARTMSDDEVRAKIDALGARYQEVVAGIEAYTQA